MRKLFGSVSTSVECRCGRGKTSLLTLLSYLSILFMTYVPAVEGVTVGPFMSRRALDDCEADLATADANDDFRLTPEEYVDFVALQTNNAIDSGNFANLPVRFVLVYYWVACSCAQFGDDPKCCVGDSANIQINEEGVVQPDVYSLEFCSAVQDAIEEVLPPTPSPTVAPTTLQPSPAPSPPPTGVPSPPPTLSPTMGPVVTDRPSTTPTSSPTTGPTMSPSAGPTMSPSASPTTTSPTASPTTPVPASGAPSASPTLVPTMVTLLPSASPTGTPTASPSFVPTKTPTASPTSNPTSSPSSSPTVSPTEQPTLAPVPTPQPTFADLLEVSFLYGLTNEKNLSADEIFNMAGNTLRTGLEIATRTITIEILNTTFPQRMLAPVVTHSASSKPDAAIQQVNLPELSGHRARPHGDARRRLTANVRDAIEYAAIDLYGDQTSHRLLIHGELDAFNGDPVAMNDRFLGLKVPLSPARRSFRGSRRLVFFTDEVPVEILQIVDNNDCEKNTELTRCAIVSSVVSVILEGENPNVVRSALISGLRASVADGSFRDAIPPEHQA